jgi:hypothetical protein
MKTLLLVAFTLCLAGCDGMRPDAGTYVIMAQPQQAQSSSRTLETNDPSALRRLLEAWLSKKGYEGTREKQDMDWSDRGSHVTIHDEVEGGLKIKFWAFGSSFDIRRSEDTEQRMMAYLQKLPELKVTRYPNHPPAGNP